MVHDPPKPAEIEAPLPDPQADVSAELDLHGSSHEIRPRDPQEIRRDEAGAADKRPVDVLNREQLLGVRWLDRAAVEDADACRFGLADDPAQLVAYEGVHLGNVCRRRGQPGADCPNRLVGDHETGRARRLRNRAAQLPADDGERLTRLALALRLADADDRRKPGAMSG